MKNNIILASLLIATVWITSISYSFADDWVTQTKTIKERHELTDEQKVQREAMNTIFAKKKAWEELTDEEKTQLNEMKSHRKWWGRWKNELTDEQKVEREAKRLEREEKNIVIDALLIGDTLTNEQEILRAKIIIDRAEKKAEYFEKQAAREIIKIIFEKQESWEELTNEEQVQLDEMKSHRKWEKMWKRGFF